MISFFSETSVIISVLYRQLVDCTCILSLAMISNSNFDDALTAGRNLVATAWICLHMLNQSVLSLQVHT